jgi:hypothetical protein
MKTLIEILRGLAGLFVDDEWLVLGVLFVVGLVAFLVIVVDAKPQTGGVVLLCGNILVLIGGAVRTARRKSRT